MNARTRVLETINFNDAMHLFSVVREVGGCDVKSPREVAQNIINMLPVNPFFENPSIAGPGFINVKISDSYIFQKSCKTSIFVSHESEE